MFLYEKLNLSGISEWPAVWWEHTQGAGKSLIVTVLFLGLAATAEGANRLVNRLRTQRGS